MIKPPDEHKVPLGVNYQIFLEGWRVSQEVGTQAQCPYLTNSVEYQDWHAGLWWEANRAIEEEQRLIDEDMEDWVREEEEKEEVAAFRALLDKMRADVVE